MKRLFHIVRNILICLLLLIVLFCMVRFIGIKINSKTPLDGINESTYVEINGVKQWISIYGNDKDNPVLLYLHGGPGSSTSAYDYAFTRKWADVYTVVTWDQRNCGKSYSVKQNSIQLTYDLMMRDGMEMTKYLIDYLHKDKITILGHSWGTYLGTNLVLEYPEYYEAYIGTGQMVDMYDNEVAFLQEATKWVGYDEEGTELLSNLNPENLSMEHFESRNKVMDKYGYGMMVDRTDYNMIATVIFNPYYSIRDWYDYLNIDFTVYANFLLSDEYNKFSLKGKTEYAVPYYNINGDMDYQTNYILAQEYFDSINAPIKQMYMMKDTTHGLLESKSDEFSSILHQIRTNFE